MKMGVLFSGGKDSMYALALAMKDHDVRCLISINSKNKESYMFNPPNIQLTGLQAESIGLPLLKHETEGRKEEELIDLKEAIRQARERFGIEGIVTGAVESVYQSERIQKICDELGLECLNPLWKKDQRELLEELVDTGFTVMITGVFAHPLKQEWLGRVIDQKTIEELAELNKKHKISMAGEGGEIETTVLDAPFFRRRIDITNSEIDWQGDSGVMVIKGAELVEK
jgi:ABC transporter with metal-binding/Fe-S-binding domain ATP-binding protein